MTLNLTVPAHEELKPRIAVFGIGGAGGNAVNNMIEKSLEGADFIVANTDAQVLQQSKAANKIQMGVQVTAGLGAGAKAEIGAAAAEESIEQIVEQLRGAHMCFITAGMGGGTGTGAAPIIAKAARELNVLTVGVVTKPFQFESSKRMRQAEAGIQALQEVVDTLIVIPNQNLFRLANEDTTVTEAFSLADDVLYQGVKGITDLMVRPGLINLDFSDVRAVMDEMGNAMMGTGEATGENRAKVAAQNAISNPLLDEISLAGATGVLINVTGGSDMKIYELDEAANLIREQVDDDANVIVGSALDDSLDGVLRVSVVATGIGAKVSNAFDTDFGAQPAEVTQLHTVEPSVEEVEETAALDDVPPPAYQPSNSFEDDFAEPEPEVQSYEPEVAQAAPSTPPQSGGVSPDIMARLNAAVNKQPQAERTAAPMPEQRSTTFDKPNESRFGLGFLRPKAPTPQPEPQQARPENEFEQDSNVPAFLRRQAN